MGNWIMEPSTTRVAFGQAVIEMAREDDKVFAIGGDSMKSMALLEMIETMPDRVLNTGIAEQNTMAVAAGMAATGWKPVVVGFAPFVTMRACEQVRTFVCYPNLNVTIAGGMSGLSASTDGVTHQGLEDMGIMRLFPNMVVAACADCASAGVIAKALIRHAGPAYLRVQKSSVYKVFDERYSFAIGKANLLRSGDDVALVCNGSTVVRALQAADALREMGMAARVLEMPCIKPLDLEALVRAAAETGAVVTLEDHQITGGLGGAVTECLSEAYPVHIKRLGVPDVFPRSGDHYALLDRYGLSVQHVVDAVMGICAKRDS